MTETVNSASCWNRMFKRGSLSVGKSALYKAKARIGAKASASSEGYDTGFQEKLLAITMCYLYRERTHVDKENILR